MDLKENCRKQCRVYNYVDRRACVLVGNDVSEWFPVNVGLRQGSMMYIWMVWFGK